MPTNSQLLHDSETAAMFYCGRYQCVLAATIDNLATNLTPQNLPFVIGSLSFRGRLDEADTLYSLRSGSLSSESQIICQFYLGVGHCRNSNYERARKIFAANLRVAGKSGHPIAKFFGWQGAGFYWLLCGRYRRGYRAAQKAYAAAIEANFIYGKTLAADLMAHNQILPGEISKALRNFDLASGFATTLGDGGIRQAVEISRAIHSAQFGLNFHDDLDLLLKLLEECGDEDNYSRSRLFLEIGRLYTLHGNATAALDSLNKACRIIYGSENRRYRIILNLRYAYIQFLQGEPEQALNLVRNAYKELDRRADISLEFEVLGLEKLITSGMNMAAKDQESAVHRFALLESAQGRSGKTINFRITARESGCPAKNLYPGDDPLGDILDLTTTNSNQAAARIIETEYWGLFYKLIPEARGRKMLFFDYVPGSILIFDRGNVEYVANHQSSVIRAIASELKAGTLTKQELIERIWGYTYQPLKHDSLIYRNISRFRALLGDRSDWILADDNGYRLGPGVDVHFHTHEFENRLARDISSEPAPGAESNGQKKNGLVSSTLQAHLNFRQIEILGLFPTYDYIDVKICSDKFNVSEITARRDLASMTTEGLLVRSGKGRATKYALAE